MMDLFLTTVWPALKILLTILVVIVPVILGVAYMTLAERKVIAAAQFRHGPNVVGPFGVLQPWADALKPGSLHTKYLQCPWCMSTFTSSKVPPSMP